jgi:hypothetical protein
MAAWEARAAAAGGKRASAFATGLDQKSPALTPSALLRRRAYVVMDIFSLIRRAKLGTTRTRRSIGGFRRIIDANPWSWEPFPGLFLGSIAASLT